jgi:predicted site-specific integrase-resolvase
MYISIGKAARMMGVSTSTLRIWDRKKMFKANYRTAGGHRRYSINSLLAHIGQIAHQGPPNTKRQNLKARVVTYARVSSNKQKNDLYRQIDHLKAYVEQQGWEIVKQYSDIGSGLNDQRRGLLKLIQDLPILQPTMIVSSYHDRLTRFGTKLLETICSLFSTQIVITHLNKQQSSLQEQLVEDVLAVLTSFAGKLHRSRRGKQTTTKKN